MDSCSLSFALSLHSQPGGRCCHKAATVSLTRSLSCSLFFSVPLSPLAPAGVVEHESELLISSFPCLTFLYSSSPGQRPWLLTANNDADLKSYFAEFPPFSTSLPPPPSVFLAVSPLPQRAWKEHLMAACYPLHWLHWSALSVPSVVPEMPVWMSGWSQPGSCFYSPNRPQVR